MTSSAVTPITRAEALAAGITVSQLAGPGFVRVFHNVYVPAGAPLGVTERARAALRLSPSGAYISHHTAGALWGGWVPDTAATHVTYPTGTWRSQSRGICAHRELAGAITTRHRGLLLAPPMQVLWQLAAAQVDLLSLVAFGDWLVKAKWTTPEDLRLEADRRVGRGSRLARQAAALVRTGVDSAPESRVRLLLVFGGLPEPTVNWILRSADGEWQRRFELCYEDLKLIIEYDGRHHFSDPQQWNRDLVRREELERQGWTFVVITAEALFNHPADVLDRVAAALRDRGVRLRTRADWQRYVWSRRTA